MSGELLAANVVRLSWATGRNAEHMHMESSSIFDDVGNRVWLRSSGVNSTLKLIRLLDGGETGCEDDRRTSVLIECDPAGVDNNNNNTVMPLCNSDLHHRRYVFVS